MNKIVIVAPYFPPSALPPSIRARLMVGHLYKFGYSPIVITAKHQYREEIADEWMVELAGNHFEKIEINAFPTRWARKLGIGDLGLKMTPFLFLKLLIVAMKLKPKFILYL